MTTPSEVHTPLPCKFCGSPHVVFKSSLQAEVHDGYIWCRQCDARGPCCARLHTNAKSAAADATERWNADAAVNERPSPPASAEVDRDLWRWNVICEAAINRARQTDQQAAKRLAPAMRAIIMAGLQADDRALQAGAAVHVPEGCLFCGKPVGSDPVYDEASGETACKACGEAEANTQKLEAILSALRSYSQADEDGVMCIVSRQAVDEAIALLAAPQKQGA